MPVNARAAASETAVVRLEALGAELLRLGWQSRLDIAAGRLPNLLVQAPVTAPSARAETIYCALRIDGWWFWWSWATPIAEEPADAARAIVQTLRSAEDAS
ncbi:MAG: hypothetical protein ACR2MP_05765 [Streptosporangiaceae bacterium]